MLRAALAEELEKIVGKENVLTSPEDLRTYSYDGTSRWVHEPDVIVLPVRTSQVAAVLKLANAQKVPVTPRGGATNVSGGSVPVEGGISLCMTRMDRILQVDKENLTATVEPGVVLQDLNLRLAKEGLFFPPDPQSFLGATLGGIISENAGGPACVKYGVTKQYVLGLEVVLPNGEVTNLGGRTVKNVVGYDLIHLFIGAEGTLGVVTKAELKLNPVPPARKTIMAVYDDAAMAAQTVSLVLDAGVVPDKIEFLDNWVIRSIEKLVPIGLPEDADAVLLFEADGVAEAVEKEAEKIELVAAQAGAREVRVARDDVEANRYWTARKAGFAAVFGAAATVMAEDITVPRGSIPAVITRCKEISKKYGVEIMIIGHAGDGNLHPALLTDEKNHAHYAKALQALDEIFECAAELGGVISGEHGIGLEKKRFFRAAIDPVAFDLTKKIKFLLDPNRIMNPGKIWDDAA